MSHMVMGVANRDARESIRPLARTATLLLGLMAGCDTDSSRPAQRSAPGDLASRTALATGSPTSTSATAGAAPAPGPGPGPAKVRVDPRFDVVITSVGKQKMLAIKALREVTGLGLDAARQLVDSPAGVVDTDLTQGAATALAKRLARAGLRVSLRRTGVEDPGMRRSTESKSGPRSRAKHSRADVTKRVTDIVCRRLRAGRDRVTPEASFRQLGADELDAVELLLDFEDVFEISIPDVDAEKFKSIGDVIEYVFKMQ